MMSVCDIALHYGNRQIKIRLVRQKASQFPKGQYCGLRFINAKQRHLFEHTNERGDGCSAWGGPSRAQTADVSIGAASANLPQSISVGATCLLG